ncbi:MAG: hypothetical protein KDK97_16760 [Verrucomicrobiales bacterium]|nr:hypothetical protein [Verrucomicrobiales bacterium]MCP5559101.1 hypothetical protein [Verrucomicrobiaceae bacterium]
MNTTCDYPATSAQPPVSPATLPAVPLGWGAMPSFGQGYAQWAGATVDWTAQPTPVDAFTTRQAQRSLLDAEVHSCALDTFWCAVSSAVLPPLAHGRALAA